MKATIKIFLFMAVFVLAANTESKGQTIYEYQTYQPGSWTVASTWITRSGYAAPPPPYNSMTQKAIIIIEHNVTLSSNFTGNNDIVFYIRNNATLRIEGNFDVGNRVEINVEEGSQFEVTGDVSLSPANSSNNYGTLSINGFLTVGGDLTGSGVLEGTGTATVAGTMNGMIFGGFSGNLIVDDVNITQGAVNFPTNLTGIITGADPNINIALNWNYTISTIADYTFVGFEIYRNLGGTTDVFTKVADVGNVRTYPDPYNYPAGATPKYAVRAVYQMTTGTSFIYSAYSNLLDFASAPLPIELKYFTPVKESHTVTLHWETLSETNNDFFTIERSTDMKNWEILAFLPGAGNSNAPLQYSLTDDNPLKGIAYYRLTQTDFDGKSEVFKPVSVYWNPDGQLTVKIYDVMGNLLQQEVIGDISSFRVPRFNKPVIVVYLDDDIPVQTIKSY